MSPAQFFEEVYRNAELRESLAAECETGKSQTVPILLIWNPKAGEWQVKTPRTVKVEAGDCVRWISNTTAWEVEFLGPSPALTPFETFEDPEWQFDPSNPGGTIREDADGFYKYDVRVTDPNGNLIEIDPWVDV
jgi:hypothetical protein